LEEGTMFVAEETLKSAGSGSQAGLWMLALFMLGLSIMAYLTVREASLYDGRSPYRGLGRRDSAGMPERERLSAWARGWLNLRLLLRGREFRDAVEPATSQGITLYEVRLRREIDRLVGKDVYHGQKEQL
jgi:hypothetical protein